MFEGLTKLDMFQVLNIDVGLLFENPWAITLIVPVVLLLWLISRKEFVKTNEDLLVTRKRAKLRRTITVMRTLIIIMLLIAIASPYESFYEDFQGDPVIKVLEDKSASMDVYEFNSEAFKKKLEEKAHAQFEEIGLQDKSDIGDSVLSRLEPFGSILLVSDGNANKGTELGDVAIIANNLNATVNAIRLKNTRNDASVRIIGPSKTSEGLEETFIVLVDGVGVDSYDLIINVDGENILSERTSDKATEVVRSFSRGFHRIEVKILSNDHFAENNVFYKTIKVVERPSLFYLTNKKSGLSDLLKQVFRVTEGSTLPAEMDDYYAVIADDLSAAEMEKEVDKLTNFVADGNGLLSVGGRNSFDKGKYSDSAYELLLPVFVATAGKKEGENSVILLIDISGSTGSAFGDSKAVDIEKALAVNVYNNLAPTTRLAAVAFNTEAYLVSQPSYIYEKEDFVEKISRLRDGGGTRIGVGIASSVKLLKDLPGSKNIILVSDGKTQQLPEALAAAETAAKEGIKIYTVGVGEQTSEENMKEIADITGGIYFRATDSSSLKLIFGELDESDIDRTKFGVNVLDKNHFITSSFNPTATVSGFNQVVPKPTARLLVTTVIGDPLLTVWRLGLGKVAALSTDDGNEWAGEMLNRENSELLIKTVNWLIGDPDRKVKDTIDAFDTRIGEETEITIKGANPGKGFNKVDENTYSKLVTAEQVGIFQDSGALYAVNYPSEYEAIGQGESLEKLVRSTGGKFFNEEDLDEIIEQTKSQTKRQIQRKESKSWPFITAALVLFLVEIFIRRANRKI